MKRFTEVVLMLCIATTMSASLFEVQGQNRRTATINRKEQSRAAAVKSNVPEMKVAPAKNNRPAHTTTRQHTIRQTSAFPQLRDRRTGLNVNKSRVKAPAPRPAPAYHPHHHGYSFGARFRGLPPHARLYHYAGLDYYYYDGIYYRHHPYGGYYICRPPLGAIFARDVLDAVITAVVFKTALNAVSNCYYSDGVYYQRVNDQYNVIEAPEGALIRQLPSDYQEVTIDGDTYYKVDDTLYRVTVYDGQSYFEVVTRI